MHLPNSPPATPNQAFPADAERTVFKVRLEPGSGTFDAPTTLPLLQAAELAGLTLLASSCRNGTCRSCICQLTSGQVAYRIEWPGLSPEEKHEGFILPCVAYAQSDLVIELPF
jgi:ferredoxin